MEKALAETVGKRLEKQAQKVRETLATFSRCEPAYTFIYLNAQCPMPRCTET